MTTLVHLASRLYGTPLLIARAKLDTILAVLGPRIGLMHTELAVPITVPTQSDAHAVPAVLSDATGYTVLSAAFDAFDDGHFDGGVLQWTAALGTERRFIVSHTGATLRLLTPAALAPSAHVIALPGCDRTMGPRGCAKFRNELNYGGQPTLKGLRNPFGSDPLF